MENYVLMAVGTYLMLQTVFIDARNTVNKITFKFIPFILSILLLFFSLSRIG